MTNPTTPQLADIPDDENGDVLRRMVEAGDDLAQAREIDFYFLFPTFDQASAFAGEAAALEDVEVGIAEAGVDGDEAGHEDADADDDDADDEAGASGETEVCVVRHMLPSHAGITAFESELSTLAARHGGEADGWGCEQVDPLH